MWVVDLKKDEFIDDGLIIFYENTENAQYDDISVCNTDIIVTGPSKLTFKKKVQVVVEGPTNLTFKKKVRQVVEGPTQLTFKKRVSTVAVEGPSQLTFKKRVRAVAVIEGPSQLTFKKRILGEGGSIKLTRPLQDCYGLGVNVLNRGLNLYIMHKAFISEINALQKNRTNKNGLKNKLNKYESNKLISMPPFPSFISENIARLAYQKKYGVSPNWNRSPGDLNLNGLKFEVKGVSSDGPSSFGPKETWDILILVDCTNFTNGIFTVIEITLPNTHPHISNLQLNKFKNETYRDQCNLGKRPRFHIGKLLQLLPVEHVNVLFSDHLDNLVSY